MTRTSVLASELPVRECEDRLREIIARTDGLLVAPSFSKTSLRGNVVDRSPAFVVRFRLGYGYVPRCIVTFRPANSGTVMQLRTRMHLYPAVFLFIWLTGVIAVAGTVFVRSALVLLGSRTGKVQIVGLLFPPAMFAFGIFIARSYLNVVAGAEAAAQSFLRRELGAHPSEAPAARTASTDDGASGTVTH